MQQQRHSGHALVILVVPGVAMPGLICAGKAYVERSGVHLHHCPPSCFTYGVHSHRIHESRFGKGQQRDKHTPEQDSAYALDISKQSADAQQKQDHTRKSSKVCSAI